MVESPIKNPGPTVKLMSVFPGFLYAGPKGAGYFFIVLHARMVP